jgi:(p)ppGpp synthase/HD superfamily hydrolase
MDKLINAINFAAVAHSNQRRKDEENTPYINHPIEVMWLLSNAGITDIDTLCGAVLHDTIEDTETTYEQLYDEFGKNVADIVQECSDDKSLPKEIRKQEQIIYASNVSVSAKLVKIADKLSNISDLQSNPPISWSNEEINGYFVWAYVVWLKMAGHNQILDALLRNFFEKREITSLTEDELNEQLQNYYTTIKMSK